MAGALPLGSLELSLRVGDIENGDNEASSFIRELDHIAVVSLQEALATAIAGDMEMRSAPLELGLRFAMIFARLKAEKKGQILTADEIGAIHIYTQGAALYHILTARLRDKNRTNLAPFLPFLKLLLTALYKLPPCATPALPLIVYRAGEVDASIQYHPRNQVVWWALNSCVVNRGFTSMIHPRTHAPTAAGVKKERTLFVIRALHVIDISNYSALYGERELILPPGSRFTVDDLKSSSGEGANAATNFQEKKRMRVVHLTQQRDGPAFHTRMFTEDDTSTTATSQCATGDIVSTSFNTSICSKRASNFLISGDTGSLTVLGRPSFRREKELVDNDSGDNTVQLAAADVETLRSELEDKARYPFGKCRNSLVRVRGLPDMSYEDAAHLLARQKHEGARACGLSSLARCCENGKVAMMVLDDGRPFTQRELFMEALRVDPTYAPAYVNLAATLERSIPPRPAGPSTQQQWQMRFSFSPPSLSFSAPSSTIVSVVPGLHSSLSSFPVSDRGSSLNDVISANNLGTRSETVTLHDGRTLGKVQLYIEALRLNPDYASAYYNLAAIMPSRKVQVSLSDGRTLDRISLLSETLRCDPHHANAYIQLACNLSLSQTVLLADGRLYTKKDLVKDALRYEPNNPKAFMLLSTFLFTATATIALHDGHTFTRTELYKEALRCDPTLGEAYFGLALSLSNARADTVTLADQRILNQQQLLLEAQRYSPENASVYSLLASTMPSCNAPPLQLFSGQSMSKRDLFIESLRCDPSVDSVYNSLANCMTSMEMITMPDGRKMGKQGLYLEAIRLNPFNAQSYAQLAAEIFTSEMHARLPNGCTAGARDLLLQAIHLKRDYARAYALLASTLPSSSIERILLHDGRTMSRRELFIEALRYNPCDPAVCLEIGKTMSKRQIIDLGGGQRYTKEELLTMAKKGEGYKNSTCSVQ